MVIAALRSRNGASFALLSAIGVTWQPVISVALILEYEAVAKREAQRLGIRQNAVEAILDAFCAIGQPAQVNFQVRPQLPDPNDEFVLEVAIAGGADAIVTHNVRDFRESGRFGIEILNPRRFLERIKAEARHD